MHIASMFKHEHQQSGSNNILYLLLSSTLKRKANGYNATVINMHLGHSLSILTRGAATPFSINFVLIVFKVKPEWNVQNARLQWKK